MKTMCYHICDVFIAMICVGIDGTKDTDIFVGVLIWGILLAVD